MGRGCGTCRGRLSEEEELVENDTFRTTRRDLLRNAAALGVALPLGGALLAACGSDSKSSSGGGSATLNWLTWSDHFANDQLAAVGKKTGITGRPKLFSDNADAILQIKQLGDAFDMVSGDALWDVKYMTDGLIDPMDLGTIDASKELYSVAKSFDFWTNAKGYLGIPVLVVDRADLLQPRHGQDAAELVAVARPTRPTRA